MVRCLAGLLLLLLSSTLVDARTAPREADPAYLATIRDDGPPPLPRGLAPFERVPIWQRPAIPAEAPGGHVRAEAEYEPDQGILIRWGSYNSLQTSMVVPITTGDPPADVWIVVSGASQENSARSVLEGGGADLEHVHFISAPSDSVWIRDYGPRFIEHDGTRAIVDHIYNRPRPEDDAIPIAIGADWNEPVYELPLVHGGGNFHLFRNRDAFMTRLVVNENPGLSEDEIIDDFRAWEGLDVTLFDPFPDSYDSTQHIDMWMLPLTDSKVLIGEYAASEGGGVPKTVTDGAAAELAARGYTVYRTPGWGVGMPFGTHYTYTNSVIVNRLALICRFDGYDSENAEALATYQSALPDSDVVQVDCTDIIPLAGAIHCIVMHVPDQLFRDDSDDPIL
ncbi:MAG TPA: agmatine deiminase family protein [Rhodanobacteraceae bacterium]|nr:agmatine deiminase family protein [Rhodanobacteraceae bacterium]